MIPILALIIACVAAGYMICVGLDRRRLYKMRCQVADAKWEAVKQERRHVKQLAAHQSEIDDLIADNRALKQEAEAACHLLWSERARRGTPHKGEL